MIHLKKIELQGFRSFKDRAVIEFPDSGAVLISGKYKNENISSGSGKSSLLMGIAYGLGFNDLPATELKNWNSKSLEVLLVLKKDDTNIEILRNPKLQVTINNEVYSGISAQEKLAQREPGSFLKAPDSEKKNLLREMLQLAEIDEAYEKIKSEYDSKKNKLELLERELLFLTQNIDSWSVNEDEYEFAKKSYIECQKEVDSIKNNKSLIEDTQKLNLLRLQISETNQLISQVSIKKQQNSDILLKIKSIQNEIKIMEEEKCPTCMQFWSTGASAADQRKASMSILNKQLEENFKIISKYDEFYNKLNSLTNQYDEISIRTSGESRRAKDLIDKLSALKNNLKTLTDQKNKFNHIKNDISIKQNEKESLEKDMSKYLHSLKILSNQGFLGYIFDELLQELENRVNTLICDIPNLNTFSVSIESAQVAKNGNVKNNITIKIQKLGKEMSVKNLSGGQICALELCFDLAISEIIRNRSGIKFNWVALDEAMDGLDIETKRCAIDTIKKNINGLIVIVDHSTEIKESFEKVINVEFDGKNSYIL
ncbi:hypothetical protein EBU95_03770 [bacterium]|nr:hypothetical protein [bacterium]